MLRNLTAEQLMKPPKLLNETPIETVLRDEAVEQHGLCSGCECQHRVPSEDEAREIRTKTLAAAADARLREVADQEA